MSLWYENTIIHEDNWRTLRALQDEVVDLIYIDPPFGTGEEQRLNSTSGTSIGYNDEMQGESWESDLAAKLWEMRRILTPTGSIYVHLDWRNIAEARLVMNAVFGKDKFRNEIIWSYDFGGRSNKYWPRKHDNILFYTKGDKWTFNINDMDRLPYITKGGLVSEDKLERGKLPTDVWWQTIVPTNGKERTGYPTQKPEKILERIIKASSNEEELVADFYCGSGTTGVVAKRLGRRYLLVDDHKEAIEITRKRLGIADTE